MVGAAIGALRAGVSFAAFIDAAAPGLLLAQAMGRWGNWFNNELWRTDGPAMEPPDIPHGPRQRPHRAKRRRHATGTPLLPAEFLYASLWCLAAASLLLFLDGRYTRDARAVFSLYIILYAAGRFAFELMRSDFANNILGLRVNTWVAALLCGRPGRGR